MAKPRGKNRLVPRQSGADVERSRRPDEARGRALVRPPVSSRALPLWARIGLPLLVGCVTFTVFAPALQGEFLNWDDDKNFLENHYYRGLSAAQIEWMFTTSKMGHYHPLTWLTLAVDYSIWGMKPFGYHLGNLVLHTCNAVWLYFLALWLVGAVLPMGDGRRDWRLHLGAALAALLFGVHPLRVESVAWATERRDVLSTFFLLPCVFCYLRYAEGGRTRWRWYAASVLLLLCSLLSKAWGITTPAVLLVLDFYPLRRLRWRLSELVSPRALAAYLDKVPFILLAAWGAYKAAWAQSSAVDTMKTLEEWSVLQRFAQASYGLLFYPAKTLWPVGLIPIHEIPVNMNPLAPRFAAAVGGVAAVTIALVLLRKRWPAGLALWAAYAITVSPVLGFLQSGPQLVADRYSYISCMTWAMLGGAGLTWCLRRLRKETASSAGNLAGGMHPGSVGVLAGAGVIVAILGGATWRQAQVWRSSRTLWEHTLAIDPRCHNAHNNLGILLKREGKLDEALAHYLASLELDPKDPGPINNIGSILLRQNRVQEALEYYERARSLRPSDPSIYMNIASCYHRLKRYDRAIAMYRRVIEGNPYNAKAHSNLGQALTDAGDPDAGIEHLLRAIELEPTYPQAHNNLAFAYKDKGDRDKAIEAFLAVLERVEGTVQRNPAAPEREMYIKACSSLGELQAEKGNLQQASQYHQRVLAIEPRRLLDLARMGDLMLRLGRYGEAAGFYQRALEVRPDYKAAQEGLRRAQEVPKRSNPDSR